MDYLDHLMIPVALMMDVRQVQPFWDKREVDRLIYKLHDLT